jgi:hypothetical protein
VNTLYPLIRRKEAGMDERPRLALAVVAYTVGLVVGVLIWIGIVKAFIWITKSLEMSVGVAVALTIMAVMLLLLPDSKRKE